MFKLDIGLEVAVARGVVIFKNYIEHDWEDISIITQNSVNAEKLLNKYKFVYFYDTDSDGEGSTEIRRVVEIEWKKLPRPNRSQYHAVKQCVLCNEDYEPYIINESLHEMVAACPLPL